MSEYLCAKTRKENGSLQPSSVSVYERLQRNPPNQSNQGTSEISKDELIMTLTEYKRANVELTKDKQCLRIHSKSREEHASKLQVELENTMKEMNELKQRVKALELNEPCPSFGSMGKSLNKMINEVKKTGNQDIALQLEDVAKLMETGEERRNKTEIDEERRNKNEIDEPLGCQCGAAAKLAEVMKVNHRWNKDYNELMQECEHLRKTEGQLRNLKEEFKEVKKIAFQKAEECKHGGKKNIQMMKQSNCDEVEALKQQLKIYEEDFMQEKDECKNLLMENCSLKVNMQKANETIKNFASKNTSLKEKYRHVCMEKEHIVKELRRLTNNSMDSLSVISVQHTPKPEITGSSSSQDVMSHTARMIIPPAEKSYGRHVNNRPR